MNTPKGSPIVFVNLGHAFAKIHTDSYMRVETIVIVEAAYQDEGPVPATSITITARSNLVALRDALNDFLDRSEKETP